MAEELVPAPIIPEVIPPTDEGLTALINTRGEHPDLLLSLANVRLRAGKAESAAALYQRVLELSPDNAAALCNLGVAFKTLGNLSEAVLQLRKAVGVDPQLATAQLQLARVLREFGDNDAAAGVYIKLSRISPTLPEVWTALGELSEINGDSKAAVHYYQEALRQDSSGRTAQLRLGRISFYHGLSRLLQGSLAEALAVWGAGYGAQPLAYSADPDVVRDLKKAVSDFNSGNGLRSAVQHFRDALRKGNPEPQDYYELFSCFFFSVGIMPEAFEKFEELSQRRARWKEAAGAVGEYPFAHFRLAVIHCYQGLLDDAISGLAYCVDHFPKKKQKVLRLLEILEFAKAIRNQRVGENGVIENAQDAPWLEAGFTNLFEVRLWKKTGLPPVEALNWKNNSFSVRQAKAWTRHRLTLEQALDWTGAGFVSPKLARQWLKGGFSPEQALRWGAYFNDVGKAVLFHRAGFTDAEIAAQWAEHFLFSWEAAQWSELGFSPAEAAEWRELGVSDPYLAKQRAQDKASA